MALVEITPDHYISNKGIKAIKHTGDYIRVSYITGYSEDFRVVDISMTELLAKLGRLPGRKGSADSS